MLIMKNHQSVSHDRLCDSEGQHHHPLPHNKHRLRHLAADDELQALEVAEAGGTAAEVAVGAIPETGPADEVAEAAEDTEVAETEDAEVEIAEVEVAEAEVAEVEVVEAVKPMVAEPLCRQSGGILQLQLASQRNRCALKHCGLPHYWDTLDHLSCEQDKIHKHSGKLFESCDSQDLHKLKLLSEHSEHIDIRHSWCHTLGG